METLSFQWLEAFFLLPLIAVLPAVYVWLLRRRKRTALRFADLGLVKQAVGASTALRRHTPPALLYLALILMLVAIARPAAVVTLPSERATVVLTMDVSASMRAQDVTPNRISAAQAAARAFVADQPASTRIGVVAFSSAAMIAQTPTINRDDVLAAIERLRPQRYTAVGSGIVTSLQALFPEAEAEFALAPSRGPRAVPLGDATPAPKPKTPPVPPGSYTSAVIILLSDGQTNVGVAPLDAARLAADRGVRIFTVGFGSPQGGMVDFGGGGFMRVQLDEETLKAIADITHARYFHAVSEAELREIYKSLTAQFVTETKRTELTALIALPAGLLLVISVLLSLLWSNRLG